MAKKSMFVSFTTRQLYLLFGIISIFIAAIITGFLAHKYPPYQLAELYKKPANPASTAVMHDFEDDGWSETLGISNNLDVQKYSLMFYNHKGEVIDQAGFNEPFKTELSSVNLSWISFGDYTGDNYDEAFVFTQKGDSLFLSIFNLNNLEWILRRHPVLTVEEGNPYLKWDLHVTGTALADVDLNGKKELIFAANSGWSLHPRGIYVFDIETKSITNQFESDAFLGGSFVLFDLTGDGEEEIITSSVAPGNIHNSSDYTDFKCWLFVFNTQLQPLFPPISFGEYPSKLYCAPLIIKKERYLLLSYSYIGNKPLPGYLYLMNSMGKLEKKKTIEDKELSKPLILYKNDLPFIYIGSTKGKYLACFNHRFELLGKRSVELYHPLFLFSVDLDGDNLTEILAIALNAVMVFDRKLGLLASYPLDEQVTNVAFKKMGPVNPVEIYIKGEKNEYRLAMNKNPVHSWLSIFFIGGALATFLFLKILHRFLATLSLYVNYLFLSLQKSAHGILILDHRGRIRHFNRALHPLLQLREPLRRGQAVGEALKERPEILSALERSAAAGEPYSGELLLRRGQTLFKAEISITPLRPKIGLACGHWVEIKEAGELVSSERLRTWSETVQKIVHDIKNPLATVKLNLNNLQLGLEQSGIAEPPEFREDFQLLQEELQKIQNRVKNLLRLASLENPRIRAVCLAELAEEAVMQFRNLLNHELRLEVKIDPEVGEIWADSQQMLLVFHILIENALEALNGKGGIEINGCLAQELLDSSQWFAEIEVCDSGPGIPEEYHEKIFEPQFSTKKEGSGLGLAIAKKIIEDHGGKIGLYSREKGGAVFRFTVPLANWGNQNLITT